MSGRPEVSVFDVSGKSVASVGLPEVFSTVVRPDIVQFVHTNLAKNRRQPYGVMPRAGYGCSAESWGTGRAVARIPRVAGGGTHRAGQAALGNMCRGGGMYAPTKTWRRWHRPVHRKVRRAAVCSALAAAASAPLVMARGHRVQALAEVPAVLVDEIENFTKTREAIAMLRKLGCEEELARCADGRKRRNGFSRRRNRVHRVPVGPLLVVNCREAEMRAFRSIPGLDCCHVGQLNILKLCPSGKLGRLLIFSRSAFEALDSIYANKKDFVYPRAMMTSTDLARVINSDEIQSVLKVKKTVVKPRVPRNIDGLNDKNYIQKLALKDFSAV